MGLDPITVGLGVAILGAGTSVYQTVQAKKAGDRAEDAARLESERRTDLQKKANEDLLSSARAKAAASGTSGLSEALFLQDLKRQGLEELDWLNTIGASDINVAQEQTGLAVTEGFQSTVGSFGTLTKAADAAGVFG